MNLPAVGERVRVKSKRSSVPHGAEGVVTWVGLRWTPPRWHAAWACFPRRRDYNVTFRDDEGTPWGCSVTCIETMTLFPSVETTITTPDSTLFLADLEPGDLFRWANPKDLGHDEVNIVLKANKTTSEGYRIKNLSRSCYICRNGDEGPVEQLNLTKIEAEVRS